MNASSITALVTGFCPFSGVEHNPSRALVHALSERVARGEADPRLDLRAVELPVVYGAAGVALRAALDRHRPRALLMTGVAPGRDALSLERVALNVDDCVTPDNAGERRDGSPIRSAGPPAYITTLPLARLCGAFSGRGIPVAVSNHAGTFLCNHVYYAAQDHVASGDDAIPCLFLHLPSIGAGAGRGDAAVACADDALRGADGALVTVGDLVPAVEQCLCMMAVAGAGGDRAGTSPAGESPAGASAA